MPPKKNPTKTKPHNSILNEQRPQKFVFVVTKDESHYGAVTISLSTSQAPKTSDLLVASVLGFPEKGKSKQTPPVKGFSFRRMTNLGIQIADTSGAARNVPVGDIEVEIGKLAHEPFVVSVCRGMSGFDTSNLFLCLTNEKEELTHLNKNYVAFAKLEEGTDVIQRLQEDLKPWVLENGVISAECPFNISEVSLLGDS